MAFDNDYYSKKATAEGKRARSYYKLAEIDQKFKLFSAKKLSVLDLGCAPGSWSQYGLEKVGGKSMIIGVDLKPTAGLRAKEGVFVTFIEGDINDLDKVLVNKNLEPSSFDLIISDMAPNTTGDRSADSYNSYELVLQVAAITDKWLKKGGHWVAKYFQGEDFAALRAKLKQTNEWIRTIKPKATKKNSVEIFFIGKK